jgi:FMN phosphatase YigB (HAD superfamily)
MCKPDPRFYDRLIQEIGPVGSTPVYFVDDSIINLVTAKKYGWITILVSANSLAQAPPEEVDHVITSVHDIVDVFPELFR